ncbi:hypothetical protein [Merdimmobilis hominis]|uniref:hypothetical protein n=1 Tax=Merdimmobilis hominis TaxID=2897707 RepID=UPI0008F7F10A|nr:hypothetical protein [Merdimmobilis hominis]
MKKRLIALACIVAVLLSACGNGDGAAGNNQGASSLSTSQAEDSTVFRNVKWGMSKEDVVASEQHEPSYSNEKSRIIIYEDQLVCGLNSTLMYIFDYNFQLCTCVVLHTESHSSVSLYVQDYKAYKAGLTEKYGEPTTDELIWHDRTFFNDPNHALSIGDLEYISKWETDDTEFECTLKGDNGKVECTINVQSKEYPMPKADSGL